MHRVSSADRQFLADLETARIEAAGFDHRAHLRAAYIFVVESGPDGAAERMRDAIRRFLEQHGVDPSKYHETITRAWVLAVHHFMQRTPDTRSADEFIDANPPLLDPAIMLTHYSAELLFSPRARATFVEPDVGPIPRHG